MMNIFIILLGIILLFGLLYYEKKKNRIPLFITKSALSLLFVLTALLQPHLVPAYYHYLLVGGFFASSEMCVWLCPMKERSGQGWSLFWLGIFFTSLVFHLSSRSVTGFQQDSSSSLG
jgi:hypothetical protein